jgi:hypothetical protein
MHSDPFVRSANCASSRLFYLPSSDRYYSAFVLHSLAGLAAGFPACCWVDRLNDSVPAEAPDAPVLAEAQAYSAERCSAEVSAAVASQAEALDALAERCFAEASALRLRACSVVPAQNPGDSALAAGYSAAEDSSAPLHSVCSAAPAHYPADTAAAEDSAAD